MRLPNLIQSRKKVFIIMVGFAVVLAFSLPPAVRYTSSPEFCARCHVMQTQYDAWLKTGLHRHNKCVDCHLPNNNLLNHLVWKGIDGGWDFLAFHSGLYTEPLRISDHGRAVVQQNCVRCHEHMVSRINTTGRECRSCHRRVNHKVNIYSVLR